MREQFPLTLCYAITAHKSQGQTLEEVIIDFTAENSQINYGSFYTALSRVKNGSSFFLKEFDVKYLKANPDVEKKMTSMKISKPYIFKKVYNDTEIFNDPVKEIKIGYINVNGLLHSQSVNAINHDKNLLRLDYLLVADTRLNEKTKTDDLNLSLTKWKIIKRFDSNDQMSHMGLLLLQSELSQHKENTINISEKKCSKQEQGRKINIMQIMTFSILKFHVSCAFVYVRQTPSEEETRKLACFLEHTDLVMGDLNLDPYRAADAKKLETLCEKRKKVLNEITTIRFNQLDHILLDCELFPKYFATSFRNHTTDHHTIVVRIPAYDNNFSETFLKDIHFNQDHWTKSKRRIDVIQDIGRKEKHVRNKESAPKRRIPPETKEPEPKIPKTIKPKEEFRTFRNTDLESCWINSCLQIVLTALEHRESFDEIGSPLWDEVVNLFKQGRSSSLNPLPLRDILINTEKQRILVENIAPINRLFDLCSEEIFQEKNIFMGTSERRRIGQQDCKDFFICLFQNRQQWPDVFNLFKLECTSFTTCSICGHVSMQDNSRTGHTFFQLECPFKMMSFSTYLEEKLSNYEKRPDWRDEDGCKRVGGGKHSTRIKDMDRVENLLIILNRLSYINGNLEINRQNVPLGIDISLKDLGGKSAVFTPIGVIHHSGVVIGNTTRGHYRADVLEKSTGQWFRTSDDELPQKISRKSVTEQGYIFLYRKHHSLSA